MTILQQSKSACCCPYTHDDVIKWKHFPRYWPFVRGIHRLSVNSPNKGQWRGTFDVFFDLRLNQQLSKKWRRRWFETSSRSLWRHCNGWHFVCQPLQTKASYDTYRIMKWSQPTMKTELLWNFWFLIYSLKCNIQPTDDQSPPPSIHNQDYNLSRSYHDIILCTSAKWWESYCIWGIVNDKCA